MSNTHRGLRRRDRLRAEARSKIEAKLRKAEERHGKIGFFNRGKAITRAL